MATFTGPTPGRARPPWWYIDRRLRMKDFREEQRFAWPWIVAITIPAILIGIALYRQIWLGRPVGGEALSGSLLWPAFAVAVVVAVWFSRLKLITEVQDGGLSIRFLYLWAERRITWNEIRWAQAVTYRPVKDFGGWGVRWGERAGVRGIVYNARGNQGVRIELTNGERVLVGSQRAEDLARAIEAKTGRTASQAY